MDRIANTVELLGYLEFLSAGQQVDDMMKRLADSARQLQNSGVGNIGSGTQNLAQLGSSLREVNAAAQEGGSGLSFFQSVLATLLGGAGAIALVNGLKEAFGALTGTINEGVQAVGSYQSIIFSLRSLQASELVNQGEAGSIKEAMGQATEQAKELYDWVQKLAIESPFSVEGAAQALRMAQAFGFATEEAKALTQATVDFSAATGQSEATQKRITLALGQVRAAGKLMGQDVLQLTNAGVPALRIMAEELGITTGEVRELVSAGLIPAEAAIGGIVGWMQDNFAGAAKSMQNTVNGLINSLGDLREVILRQLFQPLLEMTVIPLGSNLVEMLQSEQFQSTVQAMGESINNFAQIVLTALAPLAGYIAGIVEALVGAWTGGLGTAAGYTGEAVGIIVETFVNGFDAMVEYGANIVTSFAEGIIGAVNVVIDALGAIGEAITYWLQPGSPPRLLPDLDVWGKGAADAYLEGWTDADYSLLDDLSKKIEGALKSIDPTVDPKDIAKIRDGVAQAIGSFKITGEFDVSGLGDLVTRAGELEPYREEIERISTAYFNAYAAGQKLNEAEERLLDVQKQLQGLDRANDAQELQRIIENQYATEEQRARASLKLAEQQAQADVAAAKDEQTRTTEALSAYESRFDEQFKFLDLNKQIEQAANKAADATSKIGRKTKLNRLKELAAGLKDKLDELSKPIELQANTDALEKIENPLAKVTEAFDDAKQKFKGFINDIIVYWFELKSVFSAGLQGVDLGDFTFSGELGEFLGFVNKMGLAVFGVGVILQNLVNIVDSYIPGFSSAVDGVLGVLNRLVEAFTSGLSGKTVSNPGTGELIQIEPGSLRQAIQNVGDVANEEFEKVRVRIEEGVAKLFGVPTVQDITWDNVGTALQNIVNALEPIFTTVRANIEAGIASFFAVPTVEDITWQTIKTKLQTIIDNVEPTYQLVKQNIIKGVTDYFSEPATPDTTAWTRTQIRLQNLVNSLEPIYSTVKQSITDGVTTFFEVPTVADVTWEVIKNKLQTIVDDLLPTFTTTSAEILSGVLSFFVEPVPGEVTWTTVKTQLQTLVDGLLPTFSTTAAEILSGVLGFFVEPVPGDVTWTTVKTQLQTLVDGLLPTFSTTAAEILSGVLSFFVEPVPGDVTWTTVKTQLQTLVDGLLPDFTLPGAGIVSGVLGFFVEPVPGEITWGTIAQQLQTLVDNLVPDFSVVTQEISDGIDALFNQGGGDNATEGEDSSIVKTIQTKINMIFGETTLDPKSIVDALTGALGEYKWQVAGIATALVAGLAATSWQVRTVAGAITNAMALTTWAMGGVAKAITAAIAVANWAVGGIVSALTGGIAAALGSVALGGIATALIGGLGLAIVVAMAAGPFTTTGQAIIDALSTAITTGDFTGLGTALVDILKDAFSFDSFRAEDGSIDFSSFTSGLTDAMDAAVENASTFINNMITTISDLLNNFDFANAGFAIGLFTIKLASSIFRLISEIDWYTLLKSLFGAASKFVTGLIGGVLYGIGSINWAEEMTNVFASLSTAIIGAFQGIIEGVVSAIYAAVPSWLIPGGSDSGGSDVATDPVAISIDAEATRDQARAAAKELSGGIQTALSSESEAIAAALNLGELPPPSIDVNSPEAQALITAAGEAFKLKYVEGFDKLSPADQFTIAQALATFDNLALNSFIESGKQAGIFTAEGMKQAGVDPIATANVRNMFVDLLAGGLKGAGADTATLQPLSVEAIGQIVSLLKSAAEINSPSELTKRDIGKPMGQGIIDGVIEVMQAGSIEQALAAVTALFTTFTSDVSSVIEDWRETDTDTVETLTTDVIDLIDEFSAEVIDYFNDLATKVIAVVNRMKTSVVATFRAMRDGILAALTGLKDAVVAKFTETLNAVTDKTYKDKFYAGGKSLGTAMMEGLIQAIKDGRADVINTILKVLGDAVQAGADKIGAHSPADETIERWGKPMAQGAEVGLRQGAADVAEAATDTLDKAVEAGASATAKSIDDLADDAMTSLTKKAKAVKEAASTIIGQALESGQRNASNALDLFRTGGVDVNVRNNNGDIAVLLSPDSILDMARAMREAFLDAIDRAGGLFALQQGGTTAGVTLSISDTAGFAVAIRESFEDGISRLVGLFTDEIASGIGDSLRPVVDVISGSLERSVGNITSLSASLDSVATSLAIIAESVDSAADRLIDAINDSEQDIGGGLVPITQTASGFQTAGATTSTRRSVTTATTSVAAPAVIANTYGDQVLNVTIRDAQLNGLVRNFATGALLREY